MDKHLSDLEKKKYLDVLCIISIIWFPYYGDLALTNNFIILNHVLQLLINSRYLKFGGFVSFSKLKFA